MEGLFKLTSTYEMLLEFNRALTPVRIEVFHSLEDNNIYRARAWVMNTYNLYPTFANIDSEGGLQNKMLSCDSINQDISTLIAEDPDLLTGMKCSSEDEFVRFVKSLVLSCQAKFNE